MLDATGEEGVGSVITKAKIWAFLVHRFAKRLRLTFSSCALAGTALAGSSFTLANHAPGPAKFVARPTRGTRAPHRKQTSSPRSSLPWHVPRWRMADPSTVHTASGAVRHSTRRRRRLEGARCAVHATFHVGFVTGPWPSASSRTGLWRPILSRCPEPYSATASSA